MFSSIVNELKEIKFPNFSNSQLYMHKTDRKKIELPEKFNHYFKIVKNMLNMIDEFNGMIYITIDEKLVKKDESHRRGGVHVDGNYIFGWGGGGGWLTGENGRLLSPDKHIKQYCSNTGGLLISSNFSACRAWEGRIEGIPGQGGNCSHLESKLNDLKEINLKENIVYFLNSMGVHESLKVPFDVNRSLIRITLPSEFEIKNGWEITE